MPLPTHNTRLLRRQEVEEITQMSRSTIYRLVRAGLFPAPRRVGPRAVRWSASEITEWIAARPVANGDSETI